MKTYRDHYFKRAKAENYPARSVYKLQEIDKRFKLLERGMKVLDLGAAPGSWTLYAAKRVGEAGRVVAVDLQETPTSFGPNVAFFQDDAYEPSEGLQAELERVRPFDVVLSDMAPKTTGVKFRDQAYSHDLCLRALELARTLLAPGGRFVVKIFEGPDNKSYIDGLRKEFESVKTFKPKSSRSESKERFIVGLGFKAPAQDAPPDTNANEV